IRPRLSVQGQQVVHTHLEDPSNRAQLRHRSLPFAALQHRDIGLPHTGSPCELPLGEATVFPPYQHRVLALHQAMH
ncbi:MAG: hypothetical protein ACREA0_27115, partial [bacterium]